MRSDCRPEPKMASPGKPKRRHWTAKSLGTYIPETPIRLVAVISSAWRNVNSPAKSGLVVFPFENCHCQRLLGGDSARLYRRTRARSSAPGPRASGGVTSVGISQEVRQDYSRNIQCHGFYSAKITIHICCVSSLFTRCMLSGHHPSSP